MKVFLSHSSQDKELVMLFIDLLCDYMHMNEDDIFCTSRKNNLIVGENFINSIKESLQACKIIFFLITENYINSKFCLMEMGAAWAFKDNIVPIIVPPLNFEVLKDTPMNTIQGILLTDYQAIFENLYPRKLVGNGILNRLSISQERKLELGIKNFVDDVKQYVNNQFGFNFKEANVISVSQNGDPEASKIEYKDGIYKIYCNFSPNKFYPIPSNFISGVLQFSPHKNWSTANIGSNISFECKTNNNSISHIILEIKSGMELFKFYEKKIELSQEYKKVIIPIDISEMPKQNIKDISEICFVIRPNFVRELIGELEIKNLNYVNNEP